MTKYYSDEAAIERLARGVLDRSLPKAEWTHAAHFAIVLWLLRHRPGRPVEADMPAIIRAYNTATGVANTDSSGFHATITEASVRVARGFLGQHPAARPLHEAIDRLMETPLGRSDWILAHWTRARLFSVEARRGWIEPDLQPLPVAGGSGT